MNKYLLIYFLGPLSCFGQEDPPKTVEYMSVYLKVFYQGNQISYDKGGLSRSPVISMPDGTSGLAYDYTDKEKPKKFNTLNDLLNYMSNFGWLLKSSNSMPYEGDGGNTSKSVLINTNQYIQLLIFERPV